MTISSTYALALPRLRRRILYINLTLHISNRIHVPHDKKIPEAHRAEEHKREMTKAIERLDRVDDRKYEGSTLPQSFAVPKKNDVNLTFEKNGSRRGALTEREAADTKDVARRRQARANEREIARKKSMPLDI